MIFNRSLVRLVVYFIDRKEEKERVEVDNSSSTISHIEDEMAKETERMSKLTQGSKEYKDASEELKNLSDSFEKNVRMQVEMRKIDLQLQEIKRKTNINWGEMIPTLMRIGAFALVTCVVLCLERQTPISMRWLRAMEALITPKG